MPTYDVTDPASGVTLQLQGDSPPTELELTDIFDKAKPQPKSSTGTINTFEEATAMADKLSQTLKPNPYQQLDAAARGRGAEPAQQEPAGASLRPQTMLERIKNSDVWHRLFGEEKGMGRDPGAVEVLLSNPASMVGPTGTMGKAVLGYFAYKFLEQQPDVLEQLHTQIETGDTKGAIGTITKDVIQGGLIGVGARSAIAGEGRVATELAPETTKALQETGGTDAIKAREQPSGDKLQYPGTEAQRQAAEASSGNRPAPSPQEQAAGPQAEPPVIDTVDAARQEAIKAKAAEVEAFIAKPPPRDEVFVTVNSNPEVPGASYVQVDHNGPKGNDFSSNPNTLKKSGYDIPSTEELLKLPTGQYKLDDAVKMLAEPVPQKATELTTPVGEQPSAAAVPEMAGMGGAVPSEFALSPGTPTSIKNKQVDIERQARGLPEAIQPARRSFGTVWDEAMAKIDQDPSSQDMLIDSLKQTPRAVTDLEDAMLLQRQIDLQNEYGKATRDLAQAYDFNQVDRIDELKARVAGWSDKLLEVYDINKKVGTETARGLSARRMMAYEDFTLAKMELDKRAANAGRPLTDSERIELQKAHDRIAELEKQLAQRESTSASKTVDAQSDQTLSDIARQGKSSKPTDYDIDREEKLLAQIKIKSDKGELTEITPLVQKLARVLWLRGIRQREPMIDELHAELKTIIEGISRDDVKRAFSGYGQFTPLSKEAIDVGLRDLRGQTQQVLKMEAIESKKPLEKTGQERRVPSDEERRLIKQVNELKRKFGVVVTDQATQLKSALQARKTYYEHRIADLKHEIETRQRIVKTKSPSPTDAELERMKAEAQQLTEEHRKIFGERQLTDEQRLKLATAAAERNLQDWQARLEAARSGIFGKPKTPAVTSPQIESTRARTEELKAQVKELYDLANPKKTPEEIALQSLKTRMQTRTRELQEKLAAGDFSTRKRKSIALDPEAQRIKTELERAKQAFRRGLLEDRLRQRPNWVKAQDTFLRWYRGGILSSPVVFAKLTAAAIVRAGLTPLEEAVGSGLSKAIPSLAAKAPREGFWNSAAEAKAVTTQLTKGPIDAWNILRAGESELDVLYGKGREGAIGESQVRPFSIADIPGRSHGAMKASTKRAEFERSLEKRLTYYARNGGDISNPAVQLEASVGAYKDAQRSIFLQDNRVVSAYQRALRALEEPSKITGRPSAGAKTVATIARTLVPIVRVPSNIVAEAMQFATGSVTGSLRLARALSRGMETLKPDEADLIMRELKKGSIGGAALVAGFLLPTIWGGYYQPGEKRKKSDIKPSSARIPGVELPDVLGGPDVPPFLMHHPIFETAQFGATVRRVADANKKQGDLALPIGIKAAALGLIEETPFVKEMVDTAKAFEPRQQNAYFGELAKSIAIPQLVQWIAKQTDKTKGGDVVQRQPKTFLEHIETGIPGLRKEVHRKPGTPAPANP